MKTGGIPQSGICMDRPRSWNRKWNMRRLGGSVEFWIFLWSGTQGCAARGLRFLMMENAKLWSRQEMPARWNIRPNTQSLQTKCFVIVTLLKRFEPSRLLLFVAAHVKQTWLCLFIKAKMAARRCAVWKLIVCLNQTLQKLEKHSSELPLLSVVWTTTWCERCKWCRKCSQDAPNG